MSQIIEFEMEFNEEALFVKARCEHTSDAYEAHGQNFTESGWEIEYLETRAENGEDRWDEVNTIRGLGVIDDEAQTHLN